MLISKYGLMYVNKLNIICIICTIYHGIIYNLCILVFINNKKLCGTRLFPVNKYIVQLKCYKSNP